MNPSRFGTFFPLQCRVLPLMMVTSFTGIEKSPQGCRSPPIEARLESMALLPRIA
jgi:hypothetical protein